MAKLGFVIPDDLEHILGQYIPWGAKGTIIVELLWQLAEQSTRDKGARVYELIRDAGVRANSGMSN